MVSRVKDLTGQQFGSLTALRISHKDEKSRTVYWVYKCVCGKEHVARGNVIAHQFKKGDIELPSCGCVELQRKTKHGYRTAKDTHPLYKAYRGMMSRCYNPNNESYQWYGAVGISVCDEWKDNPKAFCEWALSNGWAPGLHIDKDIICKEKGIYPHIYSPDTCQWVTAKVNVGEATNRSNYGKHPNVKISPESKTEIEKLFRTGEITNMSELARMYGVTPATIRLIVKP